MAVELIGIETPEAKLLFEGFPHDKACLEYLLSDSQSRFFVDCENDQGIGFIWHSIPISFVAGNLDPEAVRGLIEYVTDVSGLRTGIISVPSAQWADIISSSLPNKWSKYERLSFEFTNSHLEQIQSWRERVPEGYDVRQIDTESAKGIGEVDPVFSWMWHEPEEFVRQNIGFCTMHKGRIVSVAWSAFPPNSYMEFAVATLSEYQGNGLCPITCAPLILHCLERGIKPLWSASAKNEPSHKAAERLGFIKKSNYFWVCRIKSG